MMRDSDEIMEVVAQVAFIIICLVAFVTFVFHTTHSEYNKPNKINLVSIPTSYSSIASYANENKEMDVSNSFIDTMSFIENNKSMTKNTFTIVDENGKPKTTKKLSDIQFDIFSYDKVGSEKGKSILNVKYIKNVNESPHTLSHFLLVCSMDDERTILESLNSAIKLSDIQALSYLFSDKQSDANKIVNAIYDFTKKPGFLENKSGFLPFVSIEPQYINDFIAFTNDTSIHSAITWIGTTSDNRAIAYSSDDSNENQFDGIVMIKSKNGYTARRMSLNNKTYVVTGMEGNGEKYVIPERTLKEANLDTETERGFLKLKMQITQIDKTGSHFMGNFDVIFNIRDEKILSNYYNMLYEYNKNKRKENEEAEANRKQKELYKSDEDEAMKLVSHYK